MIDGEKDHKINSYLQRWLAWAHDVVYSRLRYIDSVSSVVTSHSLEHIIVYHFISYIYSTGSESRTNLGSHANSPVVSYNYTISYNTNKTVQISGFTASLRHIERVSVVIVLDTYIYIMMYKICFFIIYRTLFFNGMENNILYPLVLYIARRHVSEFPIIF